MDHLGRQRPLAAKRRSVRSTERTWRLKDAAPTREVTTSPVPHGTRAWLAVVRSAVVALVALGLACAIQRFDRGDLDILFAHPTGDVLIQATWAKTIIEQGWIHRNPALGAPFGQEYYDFPLFEAINFLLEMLLGWIGGNYVFAVNAYYILTFPLIAVCSYWALARLGVSSLPSAIVSVAYALLPYHFYRGEEHLFLSGYHFVPLSVMVAVWIARSDFLTTGARQLFRSPRFLASAVIMLLTAGSGIYYAFFTAYFVSMAALYAVVRHRSWRILVVAGALLGLLLCGGILNVVPSIRYWNRNGSTTIVRRSAADSTYYGFRIASALLPIPSHRVPGLARLRESFGLEIQPVLNHDDAASSFGFVASAGFLGLLVVPTVPYLPAALRDTLLALSCLTYAGVLLATTGGFGQLFAFLVTPDIRCWERIVPFLAFFALAAVAIALDHVRGMSPTLGSRAAFAAGAVGLGFLAVADQTSPELVPDYRAAIEEAKSDRDFFGSLQQALPAGSMVFQLPYVPFPESPPRDRLRDYNLFRPYLNTTSLRWSYGGVRTRFADAWTRSVAQLTVPQLVDALVFAGFRGLVVDRYGYVDVGAELDEALRLVTGPAASQSRDGRYAWHSFEAHAAQMRSAIGEGEWMRRAEQLMRPFYLEWQRGFYPLEGGPDANHRWSDVESVLAIDNPRPQRASVRLTTRVCTGSRTPAPFVMKSTEFEYAARIGSGCLDVNVATTIPPGRTSIRFTTLAPRVNAPGDNRRLYFALHDFRLTVEGGGVDIVENSM